MRMRLIILSSLFFAYLSSADPASLRDSYQEGLQYQILSVNAAGTTGDKQVFDFTKDYYVQATYSRVSGMSPNGVFDCGTNNCLVTSVLFSQLESAFGIDYKEQAFIFLGRYSVYDYYMLHSTGSIVDIVIDNTSSTVNFYASSKFNRTPSGMVQFLANQSYGKGNRSLKDLYKEGLQFHTLSLVTADIITDDNQILDLTKNHRVQATYSRVSGMSPNGVFDCGTNNCLVTSVLFSQLKNSLGMEYREQSFALLGRYSVKHNAQDQPTSPIVDISIDNEGDGDDYSATVNFYTPSPSSGATAESPYSGTAEFVLPDIVLAFEISNGETITVSADQDVEKFYTIRVPGPMKLLDISTSGGSGDVDLYVRHGSRPTDVQSDCNSEADGNSEACTFYDIQADTYYIMLKSHSAYSNVSLFVTYE